MVYELPRWVHSVMYVVVACLLMAGLVIGAAALAQASRWMEGSVLELYASCRRRKNERKLVTEFRNQLDKNPRQIFEELPTQSNWPFDKDGE